MLRQSSPIGSRRSNDHTSEIGPSGSCGARWLTWNASRTPVQAAGFVGGMKRLAPAVDAPYGTPQNWLTPYRTRPRIFPAVVATAAVVGSPVESCANAPIEPPANRPAVA